MRVQTEEWRRFVPGSRMYKGKKTLFYNGEILVDRWNDPLIYNHEERITWEVIIVLPGVEVIPWSTFRWCEKLETVIMSDSIRRIEEEAFYSCYSLKFVRLSRDLEYIGYAAFNDCRSLPSIFIPPSCREIGDRAFEDCPKLIIFNVPRHTKLGKDVFVCTALFDPSLLEPIFMENIDKERVNQWVKNINSGREYSLHRLCCSTYENIALPISEAIYQAVKEQGPQVLQVKNKIGITPLKYLEENPYLENIDEMKMLKRYIAEKMGQVVD